MPGDRAEQIDIEPIPSGVVVKVREGPNDDDVFIFERKFEYPGYELNTVDCGLDCGVLQLVLKRMQATMLRLSKATRTPRVKIDEDKPTAPPQVALPQVFAMSPSPSMSSIPTVQVNG